MKAKNIFNRACVTAILVFGSALVGALGMGCGDDRMDLSGSSAGVPASDPAASPKSSKAGSSAVTYDGQIHDLFQARCSACHNENSSVPNWLDYKTAYAHRDAIYQRVVVQKNMPMPPYDKEMTQSDRKLVSDWVKAGAPKSADEPAPPGGGGGGGGDGAPGAGGSAGGAAGGGGGGGGPKHNSPPPANSNLTFSKDIRPIFQQRCASCHAPGGSLPVWTDYQTAYEKRDRIYQRVYVSRDMPQGNATGMTDDERTEVAQWVQAGAPEGDGGGDSDPSGPSAPSAPSVPTPPPAPIPPIPAPIGTPLPSPIVEPSPSPSPTVSEAPSPEPSSPPSAPATPAELTYAKDIQPIFKERCSICHNSASALPNWMDYRTAYKNRDKIYERVFMKKDMPQGNVTQMTEDERSKVARWVQSGAKEGVTSNPAAEATAGGSTWP